MPRRQLETKKLIGLIIGLILPIVSTFFCLLKTHDALITIWVTTVLCYTLYCWIYDIAFASFKWSWFIGKETRGFFGKCLDGNSIKIFINFLFLS